MIQAITMVLDFAPDHWTTTQRLVALAIADRVNGDTLECWPSISDIARRVGIHERSVQRAIRSLEAEGVITRLGQRPDRNGVPKSNVWTWNLLITLPRGVTPTPP